MFKLNVLTFCVRKVLYRVRQFGVYLRVTQYMGDDSSGVVLSEFNNGILLSGVSTNRVEEGIS